MTRINAREKDKGEEGLEHVSEFKYLGCVLDESGTDGAECSRKVASGRRVAGAIRSLVNAKYLQIECARVLHETWFIPVLMYDSETLLWKEKEIYKIRAVQINDLRDLLGIRRMNRVSNAQIRELCGVTKGVDERIDEGILRSFGHVERWDRMVKRVYVGEYAGSCSLGTPRERWIYTVKECLRKRGLNMRQARRMVQDWSGFRGMHGA